MNHETPQSTPGVAVRGLAAAGVLPRCMPAGCGVLVALAGGVAALLTPPGSGGGVCLNPLRGGGGVVLRRLGGGGMPLKLPGEGGGGVLLGSVGGGGMAEKLPGGGGGVLLKPGGGVGPLQRRRSGCTELLSRCCSILTGEAMSHCPTADVRVSKHHARHVCAPCTPQILPLQAAGCM